MKTIGQISKLSPGNQVVSRQSRNENTNYDKMPARRLAFVVG
jgi:hypothetical protein